ncbi:MAG: restriction endonuclease subunit S [Candidatus Anammoxibacter sp.]
MSFQLSPELDSNKLFFIQQRDIEERLDPLFYIAVQKIKNNIVKKAKYRCDDLIKSCSINRGRFGHRPRNDPRFYNGEYPFLQTGDVVKASSSNSSIEYTQTLNERGLKTSKLFQPPKLLFTIAANIGDTAILDYPSCFPDSVVAIIPNNDDITLEYLNYYLRLIKHYVVELAPYSAQRNLNNQQLAQVPIVIPPKAIQTKIVAVMDAAYARKKQKEEESLALLDSIDDYLLGELGIELQHQEENTIQSRMFSRQLSEMSRGRFDPDYFQEHYRKIQYSIENGIFECKAMKEITDLVINGNTPASHDYSDIETEYPIIKVKSYNGAFISLKKLDFTLTKKMKQAKQNDIFILSAAHQANYVGRFIKFLDNKPPSNASFVGELICIRVNDSICDPMYLFSLLSCEIYKVLLNREKTGQTSHIYPSDIKHIKIPVPSIKKQSKIANHITSIRNQAKQLQQQAKEGLEQANKDMGTMILGEDANKA